MQNEDGQYAYDRPWQLTSETLASERTWHNNGPAWSPFVPPRPDPYEMVPPKYGYRTDELTINDVLDGVMSRLQASQIMVTPTDDFSGVQGGYTGTMRPTGAGGSAIT